MRRSTRNSLLFLLLMAVVGIGLYFAVGGQLADWLRALHGIHRGGR